MISNLRVPFKDLLLFDFELLDTMMASVLKKFIQNSYFKKKVSLEEQNTQKADRLLRGRQTACLIYDYFGVIGVNDSVLLYADLFAVVLLNNYIQEFDTRWDEMLLSMEHFPPGHFLKKSVQI